MSPDPHAATAGILNALLISALLWCGVVLVWQAVVGS